VTSANRSSRRVSRLLRGRSGDGTEVGFHPHSGIATLTLIISGQAFYKETTGREGVIETGGVEWMRASRGVWLPAECWHGADQGLSALGPPCRPNSNLLNPRAISRRLRLSILQALRVIAGEYEGVKSVVGSPRGMTYLDVRLKAGERWTFIRPRSTTSPGSRRIRGS